MVSWETQRFKRLICQNTKIPRRSQIMVNMSICFQNYVRFKDFLRFSDFPNVSRFHHRKILWKRLEKPIVLDSKIWFAENTKIPRRSKILKTSQYFFKNVFDAVRFTYVLRFLSFPDSQNLSRFQHHKVLWKRSQKPLVFYPPDFDKNSSSFLMSGSVNKREFLDFQNVEIWKINV